MKKFGRFLSSTRLGRHGKPMRDPDGHMDIDITQDLTDGRDGALGDVLHGSGDANAQSFVPPGAQPVTGPDTKQPVQQESNQELSLRDQLSKAFKGSEEKPAEQQQKPEEKPAAPAVELTKDSNGKYRLADGTFASAEQVAAFEAAQQAPNNEQQQQSQSPVIQGLTPVEQQQFQSLPAELRQFVERTMEGLNTRAARYGEYDQIEQHIIGPRRQAFAQEGMNPVVAINQLFALSDYAGRDPGSFVLWFAQSRGLDLDALLDARDAAQANADPTVLALQGQVNQLTQTINSFQQRDVSAQQEANLNAVQQFAEERDANGAFKRPYITDVMDSWTAHISAIRQANPNMPNSEVLERAYQNACWSDPNVRAKMQEAQRAADKAAEAERARAARMAGSSIQGAPAGEANRIPNNANRTLREELEMAFNEARA